MVDRRRHSELRFLERPEHSPTVVLHFLHVREQWHSGSNRRFLASRWPAGNYFVADPATLFVNYKGGDYHLVSSGAMRSSSTTDGRGIGADIDGIAGATEAID